MDQRIAKLDLKTSLSALADLFLPRVCIVCGAPLLPREHHLCMECLADLPLTHFETLSRNPMADRLNAALPDERRYVYASALFFYSSSAGYDRITKALKYRRNFAAGKYFARMRGERLAASPLYSDVDVVVPVPLHWTRWWSRGYNQAAVIARELARCLGSSCPSGKPFPSGVPCCPWMLHRVRRTASQTSLSASARINNVSSAFRAESRISRGCFLRKSDGLFRGASGSDIGNSPSGAVWTAYRHILLVDDVFTTGATTAACITALRAVLGPDVRISVVTLAVVER